MTNTEMSHSPEVLSPAGNWDCARAAVASGADAIFFGLPTFNARMRADNFTLSDLPELMDYLHRHGRRGYVTMNTLIFTSELPAAIEQLKALESAGVDAAIVQDLGLAHLLHRHAPSVDLHASTQMTITSPEGLSFIDSIVPLDTAVLSRELSVKDIARFQKEHSRIPIEVFCHGALCVAYSGQCLTSESLGQRSANRGECAQACRMPYELVVDGETRDMGDKRYLLSPQDLAAVDIIPEMIDAGIASFKIEGRLKSPEYVAAVTRVYRRAIDAALAGEKSAVPTDDRYELEMTFSRGLSTGWLAGTNHPYLTHGRFGKKRGPFIGTISEVGNGFIEIASQSVDSPYAPKSGDGIVIDEGLDRNREQGARVHRAEGNRLYLDRRSDIDYRTLKVGQPIHKTSDPELDSRIRKRWRSTRPPTAATALELTVSGRVGSPLQLSGKIAGLPKIHTVQTGAPLEAAARRALDAETLRAQLGKLGDTSYQLAALEVQLEGDVYCPISTLNHLRRALIEKFAAQTAEKRSPRVKELAPFTTDRPVPDRPQLSVLCRTEDHVRAALAVGCQTIYCDFEDPRRYKDAVQLVRNDVLDARIFLATPRIQKPSEAGYFKLIDRAAPNGVLIRNAGAISHFRDSSRTLIGDFSLNVANPVTAQLLMEKVGFECLTISYDLNIGQVLDLLNASPAHLFELTIHQHMPMFHMEHCVFCTFLSAGTSVRDCGKPCEKHVVHLRDRVGQLHRLQADVGCRNTLFNGRAQTGARFFPDLRRAGLQRYRLELLDESLDEAKDIISSYQKLVHGEVSVAQTLATVPALEKLGVTEGTLA